MLPYALEESSGLSYFTWDRNTKELLLERDETGEVVAEYTNGYSRLNNLASITSSRKKQGENWQESYPLYDHHGNVIQLLDENGTSIADYSYNAFGQILSSSESEAAEGNRFRYQSNWMTLKDSGGTLLLSPTRIYLANSGCFLQKDSYDHSDLVALFFLFYLFCKRSCFILPSRSAKSS